MKKQNNQPINTTSPLSIKIITISIGFALLQLILYGSYVNKTHEQAAQCKLLAAGQQLKKEYEQKLAHLQSVEYNKSCAKRKLGMISLDLSQTKRIELDVLPIGTK